MKPNKGSLKNVNVREMGVDDIAAVYRLGHRLFKTQETSTFYRTWDAYEVTNNFNQDPHFTLVAETRKARIVGFALGTTYEKESGGWKYGYVLWMGVNPRWQGTGVGAELYHEMERRMHQDGVRMTFVDTARIHSSFPVAKIRTPPLRRGKLNARQPVQISLLAGKIAQAILNSTKSDAGAFAMLQ